MFFDTGFVIDPIDVESIFISFNTVLSVRLSAQERVAFDSEDIQAYKSSLRNEIKNGENAGLRWVSHFRHYTLEAMRAIFEKEMSVKYSRGKNGIKIPRGVSSLSPQLAKMLRKNKELRNMLGELFNQKEVVEDILRLSELP